ncbi:hypothetical protein, partial [Bacteroides acidifaciens]|uniref:hypothetical protein n=1 Tax=Bacteroides acidifaciens TaxID=85831 RepID=UPI003014AD3F
CVCALMLFRREMRQHFLFTRIPFRICDFRAFSVCPPNKSKTLRRKPKGEKTSVKQALFK